MAVRRASPESVLGWRHRNGAYRSRTWSIEQARDSVPGKTAAPLRHRRGSYAFCAGDRSTAPAHRCRQNNAPSQRQPLLSLGAANPAFKHSTILRHQHQRLGFLEHANYVTCYVNFWKKRFEGLECKGNWGNHPALRPAAPEYSISVFAGSLLCRCAKRITLKPSAVLRPGRMRETLTAIAGGPKVSSPQTA